MNYLLKSIVLFALLIGFTGCSSIPTVEPGVSLELAEFRKAHISDITYELYFNIPENQNESISASSTINFTLNESGFDVQLDFRESPDMLQSMSINGNETDIRFEKEHLILPADLLQEGQNTVDIQFTAGESSLNRNPEYLYTLFVPDRARTAFPLFDQPDLKATYDLTLEISKNWAAISNSPLNYEHESDSTKTLNFAPSDLISSYLFSFVAGDFDKVTQTVDGVEMTMLHRESDQEKAERNIDDVFRLHKASLDWLEEYTGIDYPFQKFDFALIPTFQYGGMEHVGAIQYRASSLFLDEDPSDSQLLSRASLIAHETAHMWFGDLVTMEWFNDVWTKEVFANFMAAKIMNPNFPDIDHDLNFVLRHHPSAYSVDRTDGANPIRQDLQNLNEAGQMYGAIIYNKAPIMMHQLELLVGEEVFKEGLREYLNTYSFDNATWPDLISILDQKTEQDLASWSEVWVNTPGRPHFFLVSSIEKSQVVQVDADGLNRVWPQQFSIIEQAEGEFRTHEVLSVESETEISLSEPQFPRFNTDGYGYGLFPTALKNLNAWERLGDVSKGSELINLYENMLAQKEVVPDQYLNKLIELIQQEENQLLIGQILGQIRTIYWDLLTEDERNNVTPQLEGILWDLMNEQENPSKKKTFFNAFRNVALSSTEVEKVYDIWQGEIEIEGLNLSESDYISMAGDLAIKMPGRSQDIIATQLENIENSDRKRRFEFISPALSNRQMVRDEFFRSLENEENRQTESWVLSALGYLHHPLRVQQSEKYILPSLMLLQEIQVTGDIFFPKRWLDVILSNYSSDKAVQTVRDFLNERPDYNDQLRMKILQAADGMFRANRIKG
ncbi:M1 family metallopeptidase [Gracilimonas sp.]|uniref:M1 family metallopeptidase n=1 Tax=Gracilimonas sp. TaxID=1974203 RepID=UPI0028710FE2|nr:M1 family aminopeptidase [Gracilimonas sp.]